MSGYRSSRTEIGARAAKRLAKSSRSSIWATVAVRASLKSSCIGMSSHSELNRSSYSSGSSRITWNACCSYVRALRSISSPESTGRVDVRPLGSPTRAVKSPTIRTTLWPWSWNSRSFCRTTVWPRWMSGAVGSRPSLTRSCRPSRAASSSFRSRPPFGRASTAFRVRNAPASGAASVIRPKASVVPAASRRPRLLSFAAARPPSPPHERRERIRQRHAVVRGPTAQAAPRPQAPAARGPRPARAPRGRLDRVRDDDGGRLRPAGPREPQGVPGRPQLGPLRLHGQDVARRPDEQPEPRAGHIRPDLAGHAQRDHRDRGPALLHELRRRHPRHRARVRPGRRAEAGGPGRLDDHAAVREERAARAEPAHGLPEAARGGARLPPDPQVVEGEDPHAVPELDLLRQRRLRRRVGGADVLRQGPSRLRQPRATVRERPAAGGGRAPGRRRREPERLRPRRPSGRGAAPARPRPPAHVRPGAARPPGVLQRPPGGAGRPDRPDERAHEGAA